MAQWLRTLVLQRIWVRLPALPWQCTTIRSFNFRGANAFFSPVQEASIAVMHIHTCKQIMHTDKRKCKHLKLKMKQIYSTATTECNGLNHDIFSLITSTVPVIISLTMVNLGCQLNWIWNQLKGKLLAISSWDFLDEMIWNGKTQPKLGGTLW